MNGPMKRPVERRALAIVLALACGAVTVPTGAQAPWLWSNATRELIRHGDVVTEVKTLGSGAAVVLLPGTGGDADQFQDLAPLVAAAGFRAIAVSTRGAGGGQGPLEGLTIHDYAADVAAVLSALNAAPAHIVGWAGGNRVGRCLAVDRPELVRSVVVVAAGGLVPPDPAAQAAMNRSRSTNDAAMRLAAFREGLMSPATDPARIKLPNQWPAASTAQSAAFGASKLEDWWLAGRAPVLIVQGLDDRIAPPENGRTLKEQLGNRATLVELPKAGHALLFEHTERIAEEIITFIRKTAG